MEHLQDRDYDYDLLLSKTAKTLSPKNMFCVFWVDLAETEKALRAYTKYILRRLARRG